MPTSASSLQTAKVLCTRYSSATADEQDPTVTAIIYFTIRESKYDKDAAWTGHGNVNQEVVGTFPDSQYINNTTRATTGREDLAMEKLKPWLKFS